jgi:beta-lactamase class A
MPRLLRATHHNSNYGKDLFTSSIRSSPVKSHQSTRHCQELLTQRPTQRNMASGATMSDLAHANQSPNTPKGHAKTPAPRARMNLLFTMTDNRHPKAKPQDGKHVSLRTR